MPAGDDLTTMEPTTATFLPEDALEVDAPVTVPASGVPTHRSGWRWLIPACALVVLAGLTTAWAVVTDQATHAAETRLSVTRARLDHTRLQVAAARQALTTTTARSADVADALREAGSQLASARSQLAKVESSQYVQGVSMGALQSCLGGVRRALNAVAVGDTAAAASSLDSVAGSCQTAGAGLG